MVFTVRDPPPPPPPAELAASSTQTHPSLLHTPPPPPSAQVGTQVVFTVRDPPPAELDGFPVVGIGYGAFTDDIEVRAADLGHRSALLRA